MHAPIDNPANQAFALVTELLRRERDGEHIRNSFTGLTNDQILTSLEVYFSQEAHKVPLQPSRGTTIACTSCGRLNAPAFYLKRSHGRYVVLCFDNGDTCWERSATANCSYVDQHASQCPDLAEWSITYGPDMLKERQVCSRGWSLCERASGGYAVSSWTDLRVDEVSDGSESLSALSMRLKPNER